MNILITGGAGFIGRNLKRLLPEYGHVVYAPTHRELDVTDSFSLLKTVEDYDIEVIIHTAVAGGTSNVNYEAFKENLEMIDNIIVIAKSKNLEVINIGSGAEFDLRRNIKDESELAVYYNWPIDFYGLSKNISARKIFAELNKGRTLRLFGCFGEDEPDTRFIKRSILRLLDDKPIEIYAVREMDFFYINDVAISIDYYLRNGLRKDVNLVYNEKLNLVQIANIIHEEMDIISDVVYKFPDSAYTPNYTGDGKYLVDSGVKLIGLREGIRRMVKNLK